MWSKGLTAKIAKHKAYGKEILDYANRVLGIGLRFTSVNELAIDLETSKEIASLRHEKFMQANPTLRNSETHEFNPPPFIPNLEKMIKQYRKKESEIQKLKKKEKTERASQSNNEVPKNPVLERLANSNVPVIRIWEKGKYKCGSLKAFIKAYSKLADNMSPSLIRDYLISEKTGNPYPNKTVYEAIRLYGPGRQNA